MVRRASTELQASGMHFETSVLGTMQSRKQWAKGEIPANLKSMHLSCTGMCVCEKSCLANHGKPSLQFGQESGGKYGPIEHIAFES